MRGGAGAEKCTILCDSGLITPRPHHPTHDHCQVRLQHREKRPRELEPQGRRLSADREGLGGGRGERGGGAESGSPLVPLWPGVLSGFLGKRAAPHSDARMEGRLRFNQKVTLQLVSPKCH